MIQINPYIKQFTWPEIRDKVIQLNPALADAIDKLDPSSEYKLYAARYPYGESIATKGRFCLPNSKGKTFVLNSENTDDKLRKELSYILSIPMGLTLKNSVELFLSVDDQPIPYFLIPPGKILGLWALLDPQYSCDRGSMWNMTSGARSLFMLPKISHSSLHAKLKRQFKLSHLPPKNLSEQWPIFAELYNKPEFPQQWHSEILFFSGKWFENDTDPKWQLFRYFLLKNVWHATGYLRNKSFQEFLFSYALTNQKVKVNPYIADTVKHLLTLGSGTHPGFNVSINDEAAPISSLQKIYEDVYNLKDYAPLFMQPMHFNPNAPPISLLFFAASNPGRFLTLF